MSLKLDMRFRFSGMPRCSPHCRALIDSITPALCLISPEGNILATNRQADEHMLLQHQPKHIHNLFDCLPPQAVTPMQAAIQETLRSGSRKSVS